MALLFCIHINWNGARLDNAFVIFEAPNALRYQLIHPWYLPHVRDNGHQHQTPERYHRVSARSFTIRNARSILIFCIKLIFIHLDNGTSKPCISLCTYGALTGFLCTVLQYTKQNAGMTSVLQNERGVRRSPRSLEYYIYIYIECYYLGLG